MSELSVQAVCAGCVQGYVCRAMCAGLCVQATCMCAGLCAQGYVCRAVCAGYMYVCRAMCAGLCAQGYVRRAGELVLKE